LLPLNREDSNNPPAPVALEMAAAFGIDLGTSNTRTVLYRNHSDGIVLHDGQRSMPSYVAFTNVGRLIGAAAKNQASANPRNTVFGIMRLLGRKFSDIEVQEEIKRVPFDIIEKNGKPVIRVQYRGETKVLWPEEIVSMILRRAKDDAEDHLGRSLRCAIILIPAYFNIAQRECIFAAAEICGLHVLRLINAPTAAAIDYTLVNHSQHERRILIVDIGARTLDIVLVWAQEGLLEVLSTAGDSCLGGVDFDNRILNHLVQEFKRKHNMDITSNPRALRRLRVACQAAKHELSTRVKTEIEVDALLEGIDFKSTLTRARFEELCEELFLSIVSLLKKVIEDGKIDKTLVSDIVVIGGSSRIPRIQHLLSNSFGKKAVSKFLNVEEAQARGAAVLAAILSGYCGDELIELLLLDVTPFSISIETPGGVLTPVIPRNTSIPTHKTQVFSTSLDNQKYFDVVVFEGEQVRPDDNLFLGRCSLGPISPAPRGVPQIEVTIDMCANSTLNVIAIEKGTGAEVKHRLWQRKPFSKEELEHIEAEAAIFQADEKAEADRVATKNALEAYIYSLKQSLCKGESQEEYDAMIEWLEMNEGAPQTEYMQQFEKLRNTPAAIAIRQSRQT
jgi:heat shock 70kDa protein 1/2/6/8